MQARRMWCAHCQPAQGSRIQCLGVELSQLLYCSGSTDHDGIESADRSQWTVVRCVAGETQRQQCPPCPHGWYLGGKRLSVGKDMEYAQRQHEWSAGEVGAGTGRSTCRCAGSGSAPQALSHTCTARESAHATAHKPTVPFPMSAAALQACIHSRPWLTCLIPSPGRHSHAPHEVRLYGTAVTWTCVS